MNNPHDFWHELHHAVEAGEHCMLLCVVESSGSSPGRAGFKMFVTPSGRLHGSIGGGSMEHKLVELAKSLMSSSAGSGTSRSPFLKRQIHQTGIGQDRSGMICSGEQTVAFYCVQRVHQSILLEALQKDAAGTPMDVILNSAEFGFVASGSPSGDPGRTLEWSYRFPLTESPRIAIIGGGHVGAALSRTMNQLGFHVQQYDHRGGLETMTTNPWAHEKQVVDFERIATILPEDTDLYIALVSHGYRTDDVVLRRIIRNGYKYIGMLGSAEKVRVLFDSMRRDGFTEGELARVHAPIGLLIHSKTPEEIAVSIAAEIIRVKNGRDSSQDRRWSG